MHDATSQLSSSTTVLYGLSRPYRSRRGDPVITHVDPAVFVRRYFATCMDCNFCHDSCCQYGCDVDLENVGWLQGEFGDRLEAYLGVPREQWFRDEVHVDADLPGGSFRRGAVIDGACAFRNRNARGCGIHSYCLENGIDYHTIKPHVCWMFPLMIESGVLCPPTEVLDRSLVCVDQGQTLYQAQRGEMLWFFGAELVAELDALEAQTLAQYASSNQNDNSAALNRASLLPVLSPGKIVWPVSAIRQPPVARRTFRWTGKSHLKIAAPDLIAGHGELGRQLGRVIRDVAKKRIAATSASAFSEQIVLARRCRKHLLSLAQRMYRGAAHRPDVSAAIVEYFLSLGAWGESAGLGRLAVRCDEVGKRPVTAGDLAFWLQDDNTGCQTGMLRLADASVLFWHTEEDTIGYFDRPRIVLFAVGQQTLHSFLYPYLIPGPAFGWTDGTFQAIDSLHVRRTADDVGCPTCVAAWLTWRLAGCVDARQVVLSLGEFVDACAINVINVAGRKVVAATHEIGRQHVCSRKLALDAGSLQFQPNAVCKTSTASKKLLAEEALPTGERARYDARTARTEAAVQKMLESGPISAAAVLHMLASRRGGAYAYANDDVKTHCVGLASPGKIELYVAPGAAGPDDRFLPQFIA